MVLTPSIEIIDWFTPEMNIVNLENKKALHFISETVLPHYDRFVRSGKIDAKRVQDFEEKNKIFVTRLDDAAALIYKDGKKIVH